jgi:serine/threonine protein kinase/tetratricopeptide (TPR) repeat protein
MALVSDILFGKFALQNGWISPDTLQSCLAEQSKIHSSGQSCALADLMAHRGHIDRSAARLLVQKIACLKFQCQSCGAPWTYKQLASQEGFFCLYCGNPLQIQQGHTAVSDRMMTGPSSRPKHRPNYSLTDDSNTASSRSVNPSVQNAQGNPAAPGGTQIIYSANRKQDKKDTRFDSTSFRTHNKGGQLAGASSMLKSIDGRKYIGQFEVIEELGRGAMGVVYKVKSPRSGQVVALKLLIAGGMASETQIKRFIREAEITARLEHPVIVPIHDFGSIDGHPFFTMQYIAGRPLSTLIKQRKLGIRKSVMIARELARGLHYAHSQKVIHRDIKPANILIDDDVRPHLADFGLARDVEDEENKRLTRSGAVIGTPHYMAPEQVEGKKDVGASCDIYALGVVLYQMLTFSLPFKAKSQIELSRMILNDKPAKPGSIEPAIDNKLDAITLKALAKKPSSRYSSAADMAADLDAYLSGNSVIARHFSASSQWPKILGLGLGMLGLVAVGVLLATFGMARESGAPEKVVKPDQRLPVKVVKPVVGPKPEERLKALRALSLAKRKIQEAQTTSDPELFSPLLKQAINELVVALSLDESLSEALVLRGVARVLLGEKEKGRADLKSVGNDATALFYLSKIVKKRDDESEDSKKTLKVVVDLMDQASRIPDKTPYSFLAKAFIVAFKNDDPDVALEMMDPLIGQFPDHTADIYLLKGYIQMKLKREQAALVSFNEVLRVYPNSQSALSNRCQLFMTLKDFKSAIRDAERLSKINPNAGASYAVQSQIHAAQGERDKAIRMMRRYLELEPKDSSARLLYADLLAREGKLNIALKECQTAIRLKPHSERGYRILASIYRKHGRLIEADDTLKLAIQKVKEEKTQWSLFNELVQAWLKRNRMADIEKLCRRRMMSHPYEDMAFVLLGQAYFLSGKEEDGLKLLHQAIRVAPKSYGAYRGLIEALVSSGRLDESKRVVKVMLEKMPENADILVLVARVVLQFGDGQSATGYLKQALAIEPGNAKAKMRLAGLHLSRKEHEEVERLVGELIAREKTPRSILSEARTMLASSYAQRNQISLAEKEAIKAMRIDPENPSPRSMLAKIYFKANRLDLAYQVCKDAIRAGVLDTEILDILGRIELFSKKDYPKALKAFKSVLNVRKKDPVAHYLYALTLSRMGQTESAKTFAMRGLQLDPTFEPLQKLWASLKKP